MVVSALGFFGWSDGIAVIAGHDRCRRWRLVGARGWSPCTSSATMKTRIETHAKLANPVGQLLAFLQVLQ